VQRWSGGRPLTAGRRPPFSVRSATRRAGRAAAPARGRRWSADSRELAVRLGLALGRA